MPPTVPINHHRLGELLIQFAHGWKPKRNMHVTQPRPVPLSHAEACKAFLDVWRPSLSLLWTLCFAQGKRTGVLLHYKIYAYSEQTSIDKRRKSLTNSRNVKNSVKNSRRELPADTFLSSTEMNFKKKE